MPKIAVVIDAQYDFMKEDGALYVPGAESIIPTLDQYLESLTLENDYFSVLFTADSHTPEDYPGSAEAEEFPPHCYLGTDGFDFAVDPSKVLQPVDGGVDRFILNKNVFNMWDQNELEVRPFKIAGEPIAIGGERTREEYFEPAMINGMDVEVSGVASDYCVKWAIEGLLARKLHVIVYDNLVAGIQRDIHQVAREDFAGALASGQLEIL